MKVIAIEMKTVHVLIARNFAIAMLPAKNDILHAHVNRRHRPKNRVIQRIVSAILLSVNVILTLVSALPVRIKLFSNVLVSIFIHNNLN